MITPIDTSDLGPIKVETATPTKKEIFLKSLAHLKQFAEREMVQGRPKAMVLTKLDETRMWANEVEEIPTL